MREQRPSGDRDEVIGRLADRQHGVVSWQQLRASELSKDVIARAVRAKRLRVLFRGVYAVGHTALRREGWWMAALLACGDGAALSHHTAATLWGLRTSPLLPVHVLVANDRGRKQKRLVAHRGELSRRELVVVDGLRVTTPARTIVDRAATLGGRAMREMIERAQDLRRFHPERIQALLDHTPRRRGSRQLGDLLRLMSPDEDNARSHLERLFLALVRSARLPRPEVNHVIADRRRDFVWPAHRLVVEVDGYRYHSSRQAQRRDRRRDRELIALGLRPVRFTYEEVAFEPDEVSHELARLLDAPQLG